MPKRTPPTPPQVRHINRPLAQPKTSVRPITMAVMGRLSQIIEDSDGKLTRQSVAAALGVPVANLTEWIGGYRSAPGAERLGQMIVFGMQKDRRFLEVFKGFCVTSRGALAASDSGGVSAT